MNRTRPVVALVAVAAAFCASAQPTVNEVALSVTRPAPLRYQSAFADYKAFQEVEVGNWKALNDQVLASAAARSMPMTPATRTSPALPAGGSPMPRMNHGGKQ